MNLKSLDLVIIAGYLVLVSLIGFIVRKQATKNTDSFFLADRNVPWWMLGLAGCSSYIDIGGTMAVVGAVFYLGLKSVWMTHIVWGFITMAFYMAYQAKYIRRSGVMTFAEWNATRFGNTRDAEWARVAAAVFLLVLMIFNLMFVAVGTGKFAAEFLPFSPQMSTLIIFAVVGIYVTLGGFFGVIVTDVFQTLLIIAGGLVLGVMVFTNPDITASIAHNPPGWSSAMPTWHLWSGYMNNTAASYHHFYLFGPVLLAGFSWLIFRILAGPNVWDFQFFLTLKSPRDASLAAGMWTVGYTIRWILACAFMLFGVLYLGSGKGFDAEKILPLVLTKLPVGLRGAFIAVMLAALMSTISAMINVTSSVVINDFVKRYIAKDSTENQLVKVGQIASAVALAIGFAISLSFTNIISAWETMIFVVVTMILVPATMRWHWWRFGAKAFVWSMIASACVVALQKMLFPTWPIQVSLPSVTLACLVLTVIIGFLNKPAEMDVLIKFYSKVRPFGFWGPVRTACVKQGLVPAKDPMPNIDMLNGVICSGFQFTIAVLPFYFFFKNWTQVGIWSAALVGLSVLLYFTWYKNLPSKDEV
jgi:Na+/proline symporter